MGVPQTPLGCFRGWSPAGTCWNLYADRRARLRQTILEPAHTLRTASSQRPPLHTYTRFHLFLIYWILETGFLRINIRLKGY